MEWSVLTWIPFSFHSCSLFWILEFNKTYLFDILAWLYKSCLIQNTTKKNLSLMIYIWYIPWSKNLKIKDCFVWNPSKNQIEPENQSLSPFLSDFVVLFCVWLVRLGMIVFAQNWKWGILISFSFKRKWSLVFCFKKI